MANDKDFIVKNAVEVGGSVKTTVGTLTSGSEGYSLANASYGSASFSVASQDTEPQGLYFKPDGTKVYILGNTTDTVYQYTLSTAWDISTASYDSKSFSVSSQGTFPFGLAFRTDGTKMYFSDYSSDLVYQYTLSTAWDISTASYDSKSLSISSQEGVNTSLHFKSDGTSLYICGQSSDTVYQYTLSTAWDISTGSYASKSFSVASETSTPSGLYFKGDGSEMYVTDTSSQSVFKYSLSTAWDVSTATYSSDFYTFSSIGSPTGIALKDDGTRMYTIGSTGDTIYQYSTVLTTQTLDLSTGNYFNHTLTEDTKFPLSNAGDVQSFQLEVTGGAYGPEGAFATTLYTGDGTSSNTITSNIDLATDGGLLWIKGRSVNTFHILNDTERTLGKCLFTNTTSAESGNADDLVSDISTTGFTVNVTHLGASNDSTNKNAATYAAWSFKKQSSFFDVVTYTGTGSATTISHNLGSVPGMIITKRTSGTSDWAVYHRGVNDTTPENYYLHLNETSTRATSSAYFNNTAPTSTEFSVGSNTATNRSGDTYVAYLFAHDTSSDSMIKCGSYTGNGSATGPTIDLGWQPQWLLVKNASGTGSWFIVDKERGIVDSAADPYLETDTQNVEFTSTDIFDLTSTGFQVTTTSSELNTSGNTHVYVAIRDVTDTTITWPDTVEWESGTAPLSPSNGEKDLYTITTDDSGTTYKGVLSAYNLS